MRRFDLGGAIRVGKLVIANPYSLRLLYVCVDVGEYDMRVTWENSFDFS